MHQESISECIVEQLVGRVVDVPDVLQREARTIQRVEKTGGVSHVQYNESWVDRSVPVPPAMTQQRSYLVPEVMTQDVLVLVAVPVQPAMEGNCGGAGSRFPESAEDGGNPKKFQIIDRVVNVPVVAQSKVPLVRRVQKICGDAKGAVLGRSRRQASRIVDAPVVVAHHSVPVDAETVSLVEDVSVGTQTVSRKRKISMEAESAESADGIEHCLVQGRECRREMDETRESHAAGEDLDLLPVARNTEAGGSHLPGHDRGGAN